MGRFSEVLNDLCASIEAHACPLDFNDLFEGRRVAVARSDSTGH
jgi:hypothetical protein